MKPFSCDLDVVLGVKFGILFVLYETKGVKIVFVVCMNSFGTVDREEMNRVLTGSRFVCNEHT